MAIESGEGFIIVHVDLTDHTIAPRVEITGMSVWSAQNILHCAAMALWERLSDVDVYMTRDDGDIEVLVASDDACKEGFEGDDG